jgi:phosphoethanolamine N-methyltransferase
VSAHEIAYPDDFLDRLEIIWGQGFLSPGGRDEVKKIVSDIDLAGRKILDIGSGTGGPALVLAGELEAGEVMSVDVEEGVLARAKTNQLNAGLTGRIDFRLVEPGPLPFPDASFDIVFSKDSMIHIPDKKALFVDVLRVLRPGGIFAASDWLGSETTSSSLEWARVMELEHLSFTMVTAAESEAFMRAAGFEAVTSVDRNEWYAEASAQEVAQIEGPLRAELLAVVSEDVYSHWLSVRRALAASAAAGALRPTHLRGRKPQAS